MIKLSKITVIVFCSILAAIALLVIFNIKNRWSIVASNTNTSAKINQESQNITDSIVHKNSDAMSALPHIFVYKTKNAYNDLVKVELSNDKTHIVAYPDPSDVLQQIPIELHDQYYLGSIDTNTAFLSITIANYAKMKYLMSTQELYTKVIDQTPLVELFDCGYKNNSDLVMYLNTLIDQGNLSDHCVRTL